MACGVVQTAIDQYVGKQENMNRIVPQIVREKLSVRVIKMPVAVSKGQGAQLGQRFCQCSSTAALRVVIGHVQ